jgi:chromosome segregation ATPase
LIAVVFAASPSLHAESRRGAGGDQATARLQALLQQTAAEKARLQAENAALAGEKDKLSTELESLKTHAETLEKTLAETQATLAGAQKDNADLTSHLQATRQRLMEVIGKYKEKAWVLQQTEAQRTALEATSADQASQIKDLKSRNLELYGINRELMERYDKKGVWEAIREGELFTGLKQVEMENRLEDYRDRLDELKIEGEPQAVR